MTFETIRRSVQLSSEIVTSCDHCQESVGGGLGDTSLTGSINHYITAHGYRLLHVGTETSLGSDGKPWHNTLAILGHDDPPAVKPPATIQFGGSGTPKL